AACSPATAGCPDAVFQFDVLEATRDLLVHASFGGTASFEVITDCADPDHYVACNANTGLYYATRSSVRDLPRGHYYLLVSSCASSGPLDIRLTDPMTRVPGDTCSAALDITSSAGRVALLDLELDAGTSCGGADPNFTDAYFYFDVPPGGPNVRID